MTDRFARALAAAGMRLIQAAVRVAPLICRVAGHARPVSFRGERPGEVLRFCGRCGVQFCGPLPEGTPNRRETADER